MACLKVRLGDCLMTWIEFVPVVLVAAGLTYGPGIIILLGARQTMFKVLAIAPALTVLVNATTAIFFSVIGISWNWIVPLIASVIIGSFIFFAKKSSVFRENQCQNQDRMGCLVAILVGMVGASFLAFRFFRIIGSPSNISQTFDNVFHLNATRFVLDSQNGSPLHVLKVTGENGNGFYPNGFHELAASVLYFFPNNIAEAVNSLVFVIFVCTWMISCMYLAKVIFGSSPTSMAFTALFAAGLTGLPMLPMYWGVLYPLLLAYSSLPVLLALFLELLEEDALWPSPRWSQISLFILAGIGLCFAHPSVAHAFVLLAIPVFVMWNATLKKRFGHLSHSKSGIPNLVLLDVTIAIAVVALWIVGTKMTGGAQWGSSRRAGEALGSALLNGGPMLRPLIAVSVLMNIGMFAVFRSKKNCFLLYSWLTVAFFWIVAACAPIETVREFMVGPWYADSLRILSVLSILVVPLCVEGSLSVVRWLNNHSRLARFQTNHLLMVSIATACLITQIEPGLVTSDSFAAETYRYYSDKEPSWRQANYIRDKSMLLTKEEREIIEFAGNNLPSDALVATATNNGSSLLYAFTGIKTINTHIFYQPTKDVEEVEEHLDEIGWNKDACAATKRLGVDYALDFGNHLVTLQKREYRGLNNLKNNSSFRKVASEGNAAIYEVVGCNA